MEKLDKTKHEQTAEIDYYELYDAGEFVHSILKYLDSEGCKNAMRVGDRGKDFEDGFKAGLCIAPSVLMVYAKNVWRSKKEQPKDGEQE